MNLVQQNRREFLTGLALLGAGAVTAGGPVAARQAESPARRIDVHSHFVSPAYQAVLAAKNSAAPLTGYANLRDYSIEKALENMDQGGVATAMLSITAPGVWFGQVQEARRMARELNEYAAARMVGAHKGRFGLFAVLPIPDVDGSLQEIEYAFDKLKADGVGLLTSYENKWLGDPSFTPIFDELNRRKAVVYTHPTDAPCCRDLMPGVAPTMVEYNTETSRAIINIVQNGAATKYPDIKFIFSHAGGTITALAGRFLGAAASSESLSKTPEPDSRLHHLRRFYYDTAASTNPVNMQSLKMLVTASQIVFGTDIPYGNAAALAQSLRDCGFSQQELRGIDRENALRFLPQLRS